jgi:hypothetical protein
MNTFEPMSNTIDVRCGDRNGMGIHLHSSESSHRLPRIGYVLVDSVAPIGNDQICYVKDASGWKIGGYIGGSDTQ